MGDSEVFQYIGPPLDNIFRQITRGVSEDRVRDMVKKYRERYGNVGCSENAVYAGIPEALHFLASCEIPMGICTSKRADFAEQILGMFQLRNYFVFVNGGDVGVQKEDQLRCLLADHTVGQGSIMIGDRAVDVTASRAKPRST